MILRTRPAAWPACATGGRATGCASFWPSPPRTSASSWPTRESARPRGAGARRAILSSASSTLAPSTSSRSPRKSESTATRRLCGTNGRPSLCRTSCTARASILAAASRKTTSSTQSSPLAASDSFRKAQTPSRPPPPRPHPPRPHPPTPKKTRPTPTRRRTPTCQRPTRPRREHLWPGRRQLDLTPQRRASAPVWTDRRCGLSTAVLEPTIIQTPLNQQRRPTLELLPQRCDSPGA
mmetsp:Transcript_9835/g.32425  ORF Transcript_9835/g.32425 Transcript_9835/m.32425 type:complete len:237 (-) Transcript_9835:57-767(-)